jgi:carboxyl-terminal processing protease
MSSKLNRGVLRVIILLTFIIGLSFASITLMGKFQSDRVQTQQDYQYLEVFNQALDLIQKSYVKEVDMKTLVYGAIQGMLYNLDPHSVFFPPEYFKDLRVELQGQFGGLGIEIGFRDGRLSVMTPIEGTPASRAGFKSGDLIVKIDGTSTEGMNLGDAVHKMRGKPGTQVTLSLYRDGWQEPKDFTLSREVIQIKSLRKVELIDGKFGYLRMVMFNENTGRDLDLAMNELMKKSGNKLNGLILDLRNNPGGQLDQAVKVAGTFISEGPIVSTKGRLADSNQVFYAHQQNVYTGFPMVVIVNSGSASASEIVAAALKDSGRAVIIGTRTYGKGSVQSLYNLKDGSGIKVTTAYYYTPSGKSIQAEGITPDIIAEELSPEDEARLEQQRKREEENRMKEENLHGYITKEETQDKQEVKPGDSKPPDTKPEASFEELLLKDYQLRRAVEILKSWDIFQAQQKKPAANPAPAK